MPSLELNYACLAAALGTGKSSPVATIAVTVFWGWFAVANVLLLQSYVVQIAREVAPGAVDVSSGLNTGAWNPGIAWRAWIGGPVVDGIGLACAPYIAAAVMAVGIALVRLTGCGTVTIHWRQRAQLPEAKA